MTEENIPKVHRNKLITRLLKSNYNNKWYLAFSSNEELKELYHLFIDETTPMKVIGRRSNNWENKFDNILDKKDFNYE